MKSRSAVNVLCCFLLLVGAGAAAQEESSGRAYLGVALQELGEDLADALGLPENRGALVSDVFPGSPADRVGIRPGDVIVAVDGRPVEGPRDVVEGVRKHEPGDRIRLRTLRDEARIQLFFRLGERPESMEEIGRRGPPGEAEEEAEERITRRRRRESPGREERIMPPPPRRGWEDEEIRRMLRDYRERFGQGWEEGMERFWNSPRMEEFRDLLRDLQNEVRDLREQLDDTRRQMSMRFDRAIKNAREREETLREEIDALRNRLDQGERAEPETPEPESE